MAIGSIKPEVTLNSIDEKLNTILSRMDKMDERVDSVLGEVSTVFKAIDTINGRIAEVHQEIHQVGIRTTESMEVLSSIRMNVSIPNDQITGLRTDFRQLWEKLSAVDTKMNAFDNRLLYIDKHTEKIDTIMDSVTELVEKVDNLENVEEVPAPKTVFVRQPSQGGEVFDSKFSHIYAQLTSINTQLRVLVDGMEQLKSKTKEEVHSPYPGFPNPFVRNFDNPFHNYGNICTPFMYRDTLESLNKKKEMEFDWLGTPRTGTMSSIHDNALLGDIRSRLHMNLMNICASFKQSEEDETSYAIFVTLEGADRPNVIMKDGDFMFRDYRVKEYIHAPIIAAVYRTSMVSIVPNLINSLHTNPMVTLTALRNNGIDMHHFVATQFMQGDAPGCLILFTLKKV